MTATVETTTGAATIALPDSMLACGDCGVPVPRPAAPRPGQPPAVFTVNAFQVLSQPIGFPNGPVPIELTRCPVCQLRRDRAQAACVRNPVVGRRLGGAALHRVTHLLSALALLRVGVTDDELDRGLPAMLRHLGQTAGLVTWSSRCGPVILPGAGRGRAASAPFAAVDTSVIGALRAGWAAVLRERIAATAPPVSVPCPPDDVGGCAMCGVAAVSVPARDAAAGNEPWTPLRVPLGPDRVAGHLCPECADVHAAIRSWGPTCFERAYLAHLERTGHGDDARSLRTVLAGGGPDSFVESVEVAARMLHPPRIISFAGVVYAAGRRGRPAPAGSARPWGHLAGRPPSP